jgi:hypothetical protein
MRTMSSILAFTFWAFLTGCAGADPLLGNEPGLPSSPSAPEAARPPIAQVLAAADPLQVEVGPTAPGKKESGQGAHDHSKHHGKHGGQGHSGHHGQHKEPAPRAPQETPAHGSHPHPEH